MPFLDEIVSVLNTNWIGLFSCVGGEKAAHGICDTILVPKEENDNGAAIRYPGAVNDQGQVTMIDLNNDYSIKLYHKIESITNGIAAKGFGDDPGDNTEVVNMALLVIGFRDQILKPAHWIESMLKSALPAVVTLGDGLQRSVIKAGNSSFDKLGLLGREYSDIELNYPNAIFFEMKYRIESIYKRECFKNNNNGC